MQANKREPAQKEGNLSILEALHVQISFLEKWNIATRMQGRCYSYLEIAHFTGLEANSLDKSTKEFVRVCRTLKQAIEKSFFGEKIVKLLESISEEKEEGNSIFKKVYQERETKKEIAQRALEAQLDRDTVAKIVDLNPSKLDVLLAQQQEEDTFNYSFLHRKNSLSS